MNTRNIEKEITAINAELNNPGIELCAKAYLQMQIANLKMERKRYE